MGITARIWAGFMALALALGGCSTMPKRPATIAPGDYGYTREYVSRLIEKGMAKSDVTGLSIALVDDQRVVWVQGFGYADKAANIPAAPETVYRVGSVSKLFTATAAMQLAEEGKLDIDRPLQTCLPEFSVKNRFPDGGPITPRTLMTHHSGLPSDHLKGMWTKKPEPFENDVKFLKDEYAAYPANYVFSYSNLGVALLGHALEKASGSDFATLMETRLLRPMGMASSSFAQGPDRSPRAARAYRNGEVAEEPPLRDIPAGGLNSTVLDLARFMEMVFAGGRSGGNRIIGTATLAEMLRPQNAAVPLDLGFRIGLGWALGGIGNIDIKKAGPVAHHSGATLYHRSMLIVLPEHKLGVVVLANSATSEKLVNMAAAKALELALDAKAGIRQPERKEQEADAGEMPPDSLRSFAGRYATFLGVVDVSEKSGYLAAGIMGNTLRLVPRTDGLFAVRYKLLGLFPISLGDLDHVGIGRATVAGRDIVKASSDGVEMLVGERIDEKPASGKWLERLGEYEIVNGGDDTIFVEGISLKNDAGLLVIDYSLPLFSGMKTSIAVKPLSDTEAVILGLGRGMGETIRLVTVNGEELLSYSGYLLRKKGKR